MKHVTFVLALCLIVVVVVLTVCAQGQPKKGSAALPTVTLMEEVTHHPGGKVHRSYTYYRDRAGRPVKHGLYKVYLPSGQLLLQQEYRDGLMDGEEFRFHSAGPCKGALASHTRWEQGKMTGLAQGWQGTGELWWKVTFRDGKVDGTKRWYLDGARVGQDFYDDDGKQTRRVRLYPLVRGKDWVAEFDGSYRGDVMHGTSTFRYSDGSIKAVGEWKDNEPWSGVCGTPVAGDAGSAGGILEFNEYKDGKNLGRAKLPPEPKARRAVPKR